LLPCTIAVWRCGNASAYPKPEFMQNVSNSWKLVWQLRKRGEQRIGHERIGARGGTVIYPPCWSGV